MIKIIVLHKKILCAPSNKSFLEITNVVKGEAKIKMQYAKMVLNTEKVSDSITI